MVILLNRAMMIQSFPFLFWLCSCQFSLVESLSLSSSLRVIRGNTWIVSSSYEDVLSLKQQSPLFLLRGGNLSDDQNNELLDLTVGLLTVAAIHFFKNFTFNYGKRLGNISYSLYLLHTLIGGAFVNVMSHKFTLPYQKFIVILLGVLISLASAAIFYRFIEKPSQQYTKKIK